MTRVIGNQTRIHQGSALRFDAGFQLLRSLWRPRGHVRTPSSIVSRASTHFREGPMTCHRDGLLHRPYWDGKCASAPSRAISEWKPRPPPSPRRWPGLFISARDVSSIVQRLVCGPRRSWPLASSYRDKISLVRAELEMTSNLSFPSSKSNNQSDR
jgi:hypothetical protein